MLDVDTPYICVSASWDAARDSEGSQFTADEFHALSPTQKGMRTADRVESCAQP